MGFKDLEVKDLLKQVSRSFFLTLNILPGSIKEQIGLAYLLARATDTIADTQIVPVARRHEALLQLRGAIVDACRGTSHVSPEFADLAGAQETVTGEGTPAERLLLEKLSNLLEALGHFSRDDRARIGKLLETIVHGQETDLVRFSIEPERLSAFDTDEELDRYTYDVAGCVGEFWTQMCVAHVFPGANFDRESLMANSVLFGKGLQLVNILRDIPADLRRGRCYIPKDQLSKHGLGAEDLMNPAVMDRFRPLYDWYLKRAESCLSAGWQYTTALPFRCVRIRLACAWPLLIGVQTLEKLRSGNVLYEKHRIKVSRSEIRSAILRSVVLYPIPSAWNRLL